ncbi:dynamin family protein [Glaciimonas sp. PCH181]|uniref:dynamin family protein n=1 Tax=Glaciimonas sp. PCH181 TaxID=2133943 RepID=UPI00191C2691|nr:dynamin family protein [Glaciimonas sp. PCH181]
MSNLIQEFQEYSDWRTAVANALTRYQTWIVGANLEDSVSDQRIARALQRLADDKLSIAFIAEFSRGKSELINAIFFAAYGQRILPSSAGRTTMCPTELLYDASFPSCIRLLPIETRADMQATSDYKAAPPHVWTVLPLDISSVDGMLEAFKQVSLTKWVSVEEATLYGLYDECDPDTVLARDAQGRVQISQWRHAIVNFPHPLLKQGLVIIDTPGLNAIGTEPELTLNLIPNAHAVLFVLAADTGVTKSDIDIWRHHIGNGAGRMVVLNKIDSMWDALRSEEEIERQIAEQVATVARTLGVLPAQVYPVSAQKGLVGKINVEPALLEKSRLPALENALVQGLIPAKRDIVCAQLIADINPLMLTKQANLAARMRNTLDQLQELKSLRGKNKKIISYMIKRVDIEKKEFNQSLLKLQGTRTVFARLSFGVFETLGMGMLKEEIRLTRMAMETSKFTVGFRSAVKNFFDQAQANLTDSGKKTDEIAEMMSVMYRKFSTEHGLALTTPMPFSLDKYREEISLIEAAYRRQFGAITLLRTGQAVLMERFFDAIASRVRMSFLQANRDVDAWLKVVMAPLEEQCRVHKLQLKQRLEAIERVHEAVGSLEEKIASMEHLYAALEAQKDMLNIHEEALIAALGPKLALLRVAA